MSMTVAAVLPVFALLVLGNLARRTAFLNEAFWEQAEKGTYYVLFPCLLVSRLAQAEFIWQQQASLILAAVVLPLAASLLCFLFQSALALPVRDFTSFFQGGIRFNTYVGLALVATLSGDGLTLAALVLAVMIPMVNVLSVLVYTLYSDSGFNLRKVLLGVVKNPLVVACVLGILLNISELRLPAVMMAVMDKLGLMALPMGLLAVGAGLQLKALRAAGSAILWSAMVKLLWVPLLALGLARWLALEELALSVYVIFAGLPTASSAYILARQMGGNAILMAGMITGQTLLSLLTLPMLLYVLAS